MTTNPTLIEKREELKRRLAAGEYKTLVDVLLEWANRVIQKITRQTKPLPLWFTTIAFWLVYILIEFGAGYAMGNATRGRAAIKLSELPGEGLLNLLLISLLVVYIAALIIINQSIHRVFVLWHDDILDATESISSLQAFEDWLGKVCNRRLHFLVTILGGLLMGLSITMAVTSEIFPGLVLTYSIAAMVSVAFFYQFAMVILLSAMLRQYDLKLFAADPATSELLSHLSGALAFFVYFIAVISALAVLATAAMGAFQAVGIGLVLSYWLPIIAMFVLNQTSLSSIIRRAKWKTLNEIQAKVEKLQASENLESEETINAINRLLDYHERVNKTRSSALDLGAYLNFINSLLLPLLTFLPGNLDKALALFKVER